ncbi:hypothetical protein SKAU_G00009560 [Synaphobranchus kaupii]|uniref:2-methoxy-6-polyprenyl-1,4-benzoquinol methylase, mitochondrial n=1 Tax=Synaphobranchus kaupii TaxID=118154 RepID=A0A9Q1GAW9_SYNKA|nr:hypothetical protein SKAU_G00009560 [Synaphobranchus kaupii]
MAAPLRTVTSKLLCRSSRILHARLRSQIVVSSPSCSTSVHRGYSVGSEDKSTHFGFETVPEGQKAEKVYKVFQSVAENYDVMNDAMSMGVHRLWKDSLLRIMNPQPGARLLDTAGGTGDISFRFLDYVRSQRGLQDRRAARSNQTLSWQQISDSYTSGEPDQGASRAVVCDINKEMLKVGKQRAEERGYSTGLSWVVGDAEELPIDDDQFDLYTIAFGIRNVTHIEKVLQEAYRVLKPGGRFMCLEFSKVSNPLLSSLYDAYSFQVIPVLGEIIAKDWKSYQYLVESIRRFSRPGNIQRHD